MDAEITTISGIVSCHVFKLNQQMIYFFGDQHFSRQNNYQEQGYQCDYFNPQFTKTFTHYTECTNIGVLLHNWFVYNNDHNIKTDFYLEEFYTKENQRKHKQYYYDVIENRKKSQINVSSLLKLSKAPFHDSSWMEIMSYIMRPCLTKNKMDCPYSPHIHTHYIDVRVVEKNKLINVTPYSLDLVQHYIKSNQPKTLEDYQMLKNNVFSFILFVINHYDDFFHILFDIDGYTNMKSYNHILYDELINNVSLFTVNRIIHNQQVTMYKTAWELYKLSLQNPWLSTQIKNYIYQMGLQSLEEIKKEYHQLKRILTNQFMMSENELIIQQFLDLNYKKLQTLIDQYDNLLFDLQSLSMDAYTLSRLFLQINSQDVIVYAGDYHINVYVDFFKYVLNLTPLINYPHQEQNRCLVLPDLPKVLNANLHRQYVMNKQNEQTM